MRTLAFATFATLLLGGNGEVSRVSNAANGKMKNSCEPRPPKHGTAVAFAEPAKTKEFDIAFDCQVNGELMSTPNQDLSPMVLIDTDTPQLKLRQSIQMTWSKKKNTMVATVKHVFGKDDPGYHTLKGTWCPDSDKASTAECRPFEVVVNVRYVRRGILTTDPEDLQRAFAAFRAIKNLRGDYGRKKYGPRYNSYDEVNALHMRAALGHSGKMAFPENNNGTGQACDVAHFASSFPSFHMFLTLLMEKSMQMVDPSVTMPYWNPQHDMHGHRDPSKSRTFDLIGPLIGDPKNNYQITTGPFANWTIPSGDYAADLAGDPKYLNAWGLLLAPFNANPNKYVSRFGNSQAGHHDIWPLPLAVHKNTALLKGGSLSATQVSRLTSNGFGKAAWHTIPHVSVGGYQGGWNLDKLIEEAGDTVDIMTEDEVKEQKEGSSFMGPHRARCNDCQRKIWNAQAATIPTIFPQIAFALGCLTCPSSTCSPDQKPDNPACVCKWNHGVCDLEQTVEAMMAKTKLAPPAISAKLRASIMKVLLDENPLKNPLLGNVGIGPMGDNTASLNDPWFMLHHAEIDRMFMATQLLFAKQQYTPDWKNQGLDQDPEWYSASPRATKAGIQWPNADGPYKSAMNCKGYWYHDRAGGGQFINLFVDDNSFSKFTRYNTIHKDGYTNAEGVNAVYENRLPYCYDDLSAMGGQTHWGAKYTPEMRGYAMACDGMEEEVLPGPTPDPLFV